MFDYSGLKIAFNTMNKELINNSDIYVKDKDINIIVEKILDYFSKLESN